MVAFRKIILHENLTVDKHALAGCWISVRTMEMIKGLHSSEVENAKIYIKNTHTKVFRVCTQTLKGLDNRGYF